MKEAEHQVSEQHVEFRMPVKNTFIEYPVEDLMENNEFYKDRKIRSSPPAFGIPRPDGGFDSIEEQDGMPGANPEHEEECSTDGPSEEGQDEDERQYEILSDEEDQEEPAREEDQSGQEVSPRVLLLSEALVPSVGSALHEQGKCRPCAFLHRADMDPKDGVERPGCVNGKDCGYCHLCPPGEIRRRKKEKLRAWRDRRFLKKLMAPLGLLGQRGGPNAAGPAGGPGGVPAGGCGGGQGSQYLTATGGYARGVRAAPLRGGGNASNHVQQRMPNSLDAFRAQFRAQRSVSA